MVPRWRLPSIGCTTLLPETFEPLEIRLPDIPNEVANCRGQAFIRECSPSEISVGNKYFASIKADKKEEAYDWLRTAGLGDIVKNEITVRFGKAEDNKAMAYATLAKGQGYDPEQKVSVHAGTLRLTLEDFHSRGGKIPPELFNTFEKNQTNIKNKPKQ